MQGVAEFVAELRETLDLIERRPTDFHFFQRDRLTLINVGDDPVKPMISPAM